MGTTDKKYLDLTGLTHYDEKIKEVIATKVTKNSDTEEQSLGAYKFKVDSQGLVHGCQQLTYTDIADTPTIGAGILTIQANGSQKGTFSANATENNTINITAADLGLDQALRFIGTGTDTVPTAGNYVHDTTSDAYIQITNTGTATEIDAKVGDFFLFGKKEYAFKTAGKYGTNESVLLGDEGSYVAKTTTVTGTDGLTGGGDLSQNRTISHDVPTGAQVHTKAAYAIATDKFGHVTETSAIAVSPNGIHTHTISGSGTAEVPTVTPSTGKIKLSTGTQSVVTDVNPTTTKLVTTSVTGVSGSTTASKATAGTAKVYGTADVGESISIAPAVAGGTASKANKSSITFGNANRATDFTVCGNANVGTAVIAGQADVGESISIAPAVAGGTASKATAGTAITYGTADVGDEFTYGNANVGTAVVYGTADVGAAGPVAVNVSTVASPVSGTTYAYSASYDDDELCLELTPLALNTANICQAVAAPGDQKIAPAVASTTKAHGAKSGTATFTPYTFTDVSVAAVGTAISFTPATAATRTITPAAAAPSNQGCYGAVASTESLTFTDVSVAAVGTEVEFTPATAAKSTQTFTPYTFADVTVPVAGTATTVATGSTSATATGASVIEGIGTLSKADVLKSASISKAADGTIDFVESISTGTEEKTITFSGNTGSAGEHTHALS